MRIWKKKVETHSAVCAPWCQGVYPDILLIPERKVLMTLE